MSRDIHTPLAALRASLESLARASRDGAGPGLAERALEQLARVENAAELLCESTHPRELAAVRCSVEEIARSSLQCLRPHARERTTLALEEPRATIEIDAPLLARSLARLLDGALAGGSQEILLHSHAGPEKLCFTIVDDLDAARHDELELSFEPSSDDVAHAEVAIAVRDIRRLGGTVEIQRLGKERTCVQVEIPLTRPAEGAR
jgi:K+-sensing histidine kinase KdpD